MSYKILIVEDQFVEANHLQIILEGAGYTVCPIAHSVPVALEVLEKERPDFVLLDIYLKGKLTGIDLAIVLRERVIPFVYLSANSNKSVFDAAKKTQPYGFLVKPFREKDVIVSLEIAQYLYTNSLEARLRKGIDGKPLSKNIGAVCRELGILGNSPAFRKVLELVGNVAASDTSVLILGESGTGKERLAELIHHVSPRGNRPLVKVACAALPAYLIEAELFGHERGAFTGAADRRAGKFEQSDGSTIFLDDVGDIPLDLQSKLLRVLQEREIEPLGGRLPVKVDTRIITCTNRVLEKEVGEGRFRIDLYYRLNVFPILLPPLRERKEDILELADHFLRLYERKAGRRTMRLSNATAHALTTYSWPGNIRELENFIERSVLISPGLVIEGEPGTASVWPADSDALKTLQENERDHILTVLTRCHGKVSGEDGAAELLGMKVSTLNARIRKLGIEKKK